MPSNVISKLNLDGTVRPIKDSTNFVGTESEWNALTDEEKDQYDTYDITDDWNQGAPSPVGIVGDYLDLINKPQIEGVALIGNKTASDLGLASASDIPVILVSQILSSGTKIASISINGTPVDLYAPQVEGSVVTTDDIYFEDNTLYLPSSNS